MAKKKIFSSHPEEAYISLYYDGSNGTDRAIALIGKVMDAVEEIKLKVATGNKPTVPESLEKYICIKATGGGAVLLGSGV